MTRGSSAAVIVGGGVAGLSAARRLSAHGVPCTLLESRHEVGGRIATDELDGFRLDRGFQVLLTAYAEAARVLDFEALELGEFMPGSLVRIGSRFVRAIDPWRHPTEAALSLFGGVMRVGDAPRMAAIRRTALAPPAEPSAESTLDYLRRRGLSARIIERFMRPFLGGVFLDRDLGTPRWMFDFVFGRFAIGSAALPAGGMAAIPGQLAASLPAGTIRLATPARSVRRREVELASGERVSAAHVIVATDQDTAIRLHASLPAPAGWRGCTTVYFAAEKPPLEEPILALNGDGPAAGPVNSVCVPSTVISGYAPPGAALVSVTIVGVPAAGDDEIVTSVRTQLRGWFGAPAGSWKHLRTYRIRHGLPRFGGRKMSAGGMLEVEEGITACGDWLANPSIEGAMMSGRVAADRALDALGVEVLDDAGGGRPRAGAELKDGEEAKDGDEPGESHP